MDVERLAQRLRPSRLSANPARQRARRGGLGLGVSGSRAVRADPALLEVLARLATDLDRAAAALERLAPPATESRHPVVLALVEAFGGSAFSSSEAWALARSQAREAFALGLAQPSLPEALQRAGIENPHGLGRWLGGRAVEGVVRIATTRDGTLWAVISRDHETAHRLRATPARR